MAFTNTKYISGYLFLYSIVSGALIYIELYKVKYFLVFNYNEGVNHVCNMELYILLLTQLLVIFGNNAGVLKKSDGTCYR